MTRDELNARIEKKEQDIAKIEKRIQKWTTGMNDEAKAIAAACELVYDDPKYKEAYKAYDEYKKAHGNDPTVYRQDYEWNKGPNLGEAYSAYRDLAEAKATLNKYKVQLDKISNFEKEEKIEIIWNFLQNWRKEAYEFYVDNVALYKSLKDNKQSNWEAYKETKRYQEEYNRYINYGYSPSRAEETVKSYWERYYYDAIERLTKEIYLWDGKWDDEKLNKTLDKDLHNKYTRLVHDVTEKAGEIVDASNLYIDKKGNIAGTIKGTKATVNLWTTLVIGEVQCPHYRSYVNIAK